MSNPKARILCYMDPRIIDFAKNDDALSQQFIVFKHGGRINDRKAIPVIIEIHSSISKAKEET